MQPPRMSSGLDVNVSSLTTPGVGPFQFGPWLWSSSLKYLAPVVWKVERVKCSPILLSSFVSLSLRHDKCKLESWRFHLSCPKQWEHLHRQEESVCSKSFEVVNKLFIIKQSASKNHKKTVVERFPSLLLFMLLWLHVVAKISSTLGHLFWVVNCVSCFKLFVYPFKYCGILLFHDSIYVLCNFQYESFTDFGENRLKVYSVADVPRECHAIRWYNKKSGTILLPRQYWDCKQWLPN